MAKTKITEVMMDDKTIDASKEIAMVFSIANTLRGPYKPDKYKDVIIPMIILRRWECALAPTKKAVIETYKKKPDTPAQLLCRKSGYQFYNTCEFDLKKLLTDENGWNAELMSPVTEEPSAPEGITLEIAFEGEKIDAVFKNEGTKRWNFGESYSVQVNLDGAWYYVPTDPVTNWVFNSIGYTLEAGGDWEETYSLNMYGELPTGLYRLVVYGLTAEFTVE